MVAFQPLHQLLSGTAAVVTHGGAGTVLGTLAQGRPLVVVPQGADQFLQAAAVVRAGCGLATAAGQPDPDELRATVRAVLEDAAYAAAAVDVQKQIVAMTGPAQMAERLARAIAH